MAARVTLTELSSKVIIHQIYMYLCSNCITCDREMMQDPESVIITNTSEDVLDLIGWQLRDEVTDVHDAACRFLFVFAFFLVSRQHVFYGCLLHPSCLICVSPSHSDLQRGSHAFEIQHDNQNHGPFTLQPGESTTFWFSAGYKFPILVSSVPEPLSCVLAGRQPDGFHESHVNPSHIFWTTKKGDKRKAAIINDDGDTINLTDPEGAVVASAACGSCVKVRHWFRTTIGERVRGLVSQNWQIQSQINKAQDSGCGLLLLVPVT